jgi:hypothetical protein
MHFPEQRGLRLERVVAAFPERAVQGVAWARKFPERDPGMTWRAADGIRTHDLLHGKPAAGCT